MCVTLKIKFQFSSHFLSIFLSLPSFFLFFSLIFFFVYIVFPSFFLSLFVSFPSLFLFFSLIFFLLSIFLFLFFFSFGLFIKFSLLLFLIKSLRELCKYVWVLYRKENHLLTFFWQHIITFFKTRKILFRFLSWLLCSLGPYNFERRTKHLKS